MGKCGSFARESLMSVAVMGYEVGIAGLTRIEDILLVAG